MSIILAQTAADSHASIAIRSNVQQRVVRALLFLWTVLVACPVRYWSIDDSSDNTWVFALNYGAAHGLAFGRDLIWTTGPLGYLVFPMDIGSNLVQALRFQGAVWVVLLVILADLFFRTGLPLRNLTYFSIFFSLSAPFYWFNYMGTENLLLAGALILLVLARRQGVGSGARMRFVGALVLAGLIPLIKLTGGLIIGCAILGFLCDRAICQRQRIWREVALAISIPLAVIAAGFGLFLPSVDAFVRYVRDSMEIIGGYSYAMSLPRDPLEFAGIAEAIIGIGALLFVRTRASRPTAWFLTFLFALPLLMSIKHGFVRQDAHVLNFFCFVGLALAIIASCLPLDGERSIVAFLVLLNFGILSLEYMYSRIGLDQAFAECTGFRGAGLALKVLRIDEVRADLKAGTSYPPDAKLETELRNIVGDSPIASLSLVYAGAAMEGINLQLYPVLQRYSAYTKPLDERNAAWIRANGPRFLVFDGLSIDSRQFWAETPAMWLEIYRWYNTRRVGTLRVLLERRTTPRFARLVSTGQQIIRPTDGLTLPALAGPSFWKMKCASNFTGSLLKSFFRVPEVFIQLEDLDKKRTTYRVLVELLQSPVLGGSLPANLKELASLLETNAVPEPRIQKIYFSGPGLSSYTSACSVEFLTPLQ